MMGRIDVSGRPCSNCKATGKDPRKRTRPCPQCGGSGVEVYCETCGETMPCSGENPDILDQSFCEKYIPPKKFADTA
jgi:RecJ-like exonuclease